MSASADAAFERRPKCGREFGVANFALVIVLATTGHRWANVAAFGTNRTMRPTNPFEMMPTRIIIRKLPEESHDQHAETHERVYHVRKSTVL